MQSNIQTIHIPYQIDRLRQVGTYSQPSESSQSCLCCVCPGTDCQFCNSGCTPSSFLVIIRGVRDESDEVMGINCLEYCLIQDTSESCQWELDESDGVVSLAQINVTADETTLVVYDTNSKIIFLGSINTSNFLCGTLPSFFPENITEASNSEHSGFGGWATIIPCCECSEFTGSSSGDN